MPIKGKPEASERCPTQNIYSLLWLIDEMGDKHGVHLSTLNSLKGLEYKMVILCDVHEKTAPLDISIFTDMNDVEKEQYLQSERALLYVAFTRAMYKLIITGSGQPSVLVWL